MFSHIIPNKRGIHILFFLFLCENMLWVLIRTALMGWVGGGGGGGGVGVEEASNVYPLCMFSHRNKSSFGMEKSIAKKKTIQIN